MRSLFIAVLCFFAGTVWAADPDIALHIQTRKVMLGAQCPSLLVSNGAARGQDRYGKALCLLYGMGVAQDAENALALLRQLGADNHAEAQMALADALQQGDATAQVEALQWYARAAEAGDVRAQLRHTRLAQRVQAAQALATPSAPANDSIVVDAATDVSELPVGYHCHPFAFGKKVCHTGPQ